MAKLCSQWTMMSQQTMMNGKGDSHMNCPNCHKKSEIYAILAPRKHLQAGKDILWCPSCGTIFTNPNLTEKAEDIRVPGKNRIGFTSVRSERHGS